LIGSVPADDQVTPSTGLAEARRNEPQRVCSNCGSELSADLPQGVCSACLLKITAGLQKVSAQLELNKAAPQNGAE